MRKIDMYKEKKQRGHLVGGWFIFSVVLNFAVSQTIHPWFEEFRQSVRGKALANALGASFETADALYYNPASIAHASSVEFFTGYAKPAGGFTAFDDGSSLSQFDLGLVFPFSNPINLYQAGWKKDFITTNAALGLTFGQQRYDSGDGAAMLTQRHVGITYAKNLDNVIFQGARISMGITGNIYMLNFGGIDVMNNAAFTATSKTSFSPDLGVLYNFSDYILVSLVLQNLFPARISPLANGETITRTTRLGVGWQLGDLGQVPFLQSVLVVGEWRMHSAPDQGQNANSNLAGINTYHAGWESWYRIPKYVDIAGRIGFAVGEQSYSEANLGLGFSRYFDAKKRYRFDLNFTWSWSSFASSLGSDHRYYVAGVFRYYFPDSAFPGREGLTGQTRSLDEDLFKEKEERGPMPEKGDKVTPKKPQTQGKNVNIKPKSEAQKTEAKPGP